MTTTTSLHNRDITWLLRSVSLTLSVFSAPSWLYSPYSLDTELYWAATVATLLASSSMAIAMIVSHCINFVCDGKWRPETACWTATVPRHFLFISSVGCLLTSMRADSRAFLVLFARHLFERGLDNVYPSFIIIRFNYRFRARQRHKQMSFTRLDALWHRNIMTTSYLWTKIAVLLNIRMWLVCLFACTLWFMASN